MKKYATLLAFCAPLLGPVMEARADVGIGASLDASFLGKVQMRTPAQMQAQWQAPVQLPPQVQTAPPAERPYGYRSVPRPQYGSAPTPRRYTNAYPGYTELRVAPVYGGIAWIYDGDTLVGSIEGRPGVMFVPEGRAYGVVMTRGGRMVWQGHVQATPGVVALSLDRYGSPIVERVPPPPSHGAYPPPAFELERPLSAIQFRTTIADMEALQDDRSRLAFVVEVFGNRAVTVGQAHDLIARLAFEESRLRALEILAPGLIGRGDASRLLDTFVTYEGRARAAAILRIP
ncbi:DUF4476 domain-containing protein [Polyangium sp. y55x31]|uniref:DUF4476 domain-containing protein n=1 Tax=Polyangium sp. y55x31 TaxID=3042688 RepID=UPI0024832DA1|nr:DUF4476 domain-containing protein [Polyangium sp. y55x31]MDI1483356.1 DUF4476 domain-containing protein [Polyangium sp. y55x31]